MCALNISSIPIALSFLFLSIKAVNTWVIYIKSKAKKVLSVQFPCVSIHTHIVTKRNIHHFFHIVYMRKHKYGSLGINVCSSLQLVIYYYEGKYKRPMYICSARFFKYTYYSQRNPTIIFI